MIKSIQITDFLQIRDAQLDLADLTMFYGPNGAGKTSIADAIFHALSGLPVRGLTLPQLVRQGAKSFDVVVELANGLRFGRHRAQSGAGECLMEGTELGADEYRAAVIIEVGASVDAIAAALRAGEILRMGPGELQELLIPLTGARFDAEAIRSVLPANVVDIATRGGIGLPGSLDGERDGFARCAVTAEEARKRFKRDVAKLDGDLARLPVPAAEQLATLARIEGDAAAFIEKTLEGLRIRRDAALRSEDAVRAYNQGAIDTKREAAKRRLGEIEQLPRAEPVDTAKQEADARATRKRIATLAAQIAGDERALASVRVSAAGPKELPAGDLGALSNALTKSREKAEGFRKSVDIAGAEGKKRAALLEMAQAAAGGCCQSCGHEVTPADVVRLTASLEEARDGFVEYREKLDKENAEVARLAAIIAEGDAVRARIAAGAEVARLTNKLDEDRQVVTGLETETARLEREVADAGPARAAHDAYRRAQGEAEQLRAELARLDAVVAPTGPADDAAELTGKIARGETLLVAAHAAAKRAAVEREIEATKQAIRDADLVAQAFGPTGLRAELINAGVRPFLDEANTTLAQLLPGYAVEIDAVRFAFVVRTGDVVVSPEALSDGQWTILTYVLQLAVARLAGVKLLILDRGELIDEAGNAAVKRLVMACLDEGIQVVRFSCKAPPTKVPAGIAMYVVEAGTVRQLGVREAA